VQEKPLSIALREINEGLLTAEALDPERGATDRSSVRREYPDAWRPPAPRCRASSSASPAASPRTRPRAAARLTEAGHDVTVVPTAAPAVRRRGHLGRPVRASRCRPTCGTDVTRCRTCGSGRRPTSSSSRRPPPTCSPGPPTAWPTTCSPTSCSPPAARWCWPRRCTPRCGSTRPPGQRRDPARARRARARAGGRAGSPGPTPARAAARAGGDRRRLPDVLVLRRATAPPRPAGRRVVVRPAAPASRSTRSASSATAQRRQGYALAARRGCSAAPRSRS
jgi:hypothetical protein